jgi:protein phosphatase 1D
MEDFFSVAYQQTEDERDLEYAFFGIYDGHGGAEAAAFAKEHLMETIIKHKTFWSDNDEDVLRAIKDGYIATHYAMWKEQEKWPRTASGLPSTAGTTASVAFIRRGKIYIGHVGDSGIILGYQENGSTEWRARPLTRDHKPENLDEMTRINQCGGKVVAKSGVPRVVWNRPKMGHQGPVRRSTPIDEIPFLAVARSLGDLWSYNSQINQFIVSPDPDCAVFTIDPNIHRCLIFGTDGLFNMLSPQNAVHIVQQAERHNENAALSDSINKTWLNPSKLLVERALERWHNTKMRADNTSVVTLMLDPPGPPRAQVLKNRKKNAYPDSHRSAAGSILATSDLAS